MYTNMTYKSTWNIMNFPFVTQHIARLGKSVIAQTAYIRTLACVYSLMFDERRPVSEWFWHVLHWNGRSPVCVRRCDWNVPWKRNVWKHNEQVNVWWRLLLGFATSELSVCFRFLEILQDLDARLSIIGEGWLQDGWMCHGNKTESFAAFGVEHKWWTNASMDKSRAGMSKPCWFSSSLSRLPDLVSYW